jgi:hypothetical protein
LTNLIAFDLHVRWARWCVSVWIEWIELKVKKNARAWIRQEWTCNLSRKEEALWYSFKQGVTKSASIAKRIKIRNADNTFTYMCKCMWKLSSSIDCWHNDNIHG